MQASTERILGRLVGIPAIIAGLGFLALAALAWLTDGWEWNLATVMLTLVVAAIGTGLLLMGRSFLKSKPDSAPPSKIRPDSTSNSPPIEIA